METFSRNALLPFALFAAVLLFKCTSEQARRIEQADRLVRERRYTEASLYLGSAYELMPEGKEAPRALYRLGELQHLHLKDTEAALRTYAKILRFHPSSPWAPKAQVRTADIYFYEKRDFPQALEGYQAVLDSFPGVEKPERIRFQAALCYLKMGAYRQAALEFENLALKHPASSLADRARFESGLCFFHAGETQKALEQLGGLSRALDEGGRDPALAARARFNAGRVRESRGEYAEALALYREARKGHPAPRIIAARVESVRRRMKDLGLPEEEETGAGEEEKKGKEEEKKDEQP